MVSFLSGAPLGTRTPNLRIRSALLYPIELIAHAPKFVEVTQHLYIILDVDAFVKGFFEFSVIISAMLHSSGSSASGSCGKQMVRPEGILGTRQRRSLFLLPGIWL